MNLEEELRTLESQSALMQQSINENNTTLYYKPINTYEAIYLKSSLLKTRESKLIKYYSTL